MVNWRNITKFALASGIVFIAFMVIAGYVNYKIDRLLYSSSAPASFIDYTIFQAMLPFLVFAVLSFVVLALSLFSKKSEDKKETEPQPEQEAPPEEETEKEKEAQETEDLFKEAPT